MATTVTQSELDTLNEENKVSTQAADVEQTYTGKFIGTLVGNATTAKELEAPYNFTLTGDATGTTRVNAKDTNLKVTVNHATEADTADFAGKTNLAARATLADMANTAEFAYRAGRLSNLLIKLHGGVTGSGQLTNADTMDIAISGVDVSYFFVFSALPEKNPDITKAYVDLSGHHFWIYDTANTVWKDAYEYLTKTLELHGQRLDVLEKSKTTNTADIETLKSTVSQQGAKLTNHEDRITVNEKGITAHDARITTNATDISALDKRLTAAEKLNTSQSESLTDHEKRIGNIETTTDVGQISTRVQAIEDKNVEQDTKIANEIKTRESADKEIQASITNLPNSFVTLNTEQTITKKKIFSIASGDAISINANNMDSTVIPSENIYHNIAIKDKNNQLISVFQASQDTDGYNVTSVGSATKKTDGKQDFCFLTTKIKSDGTKGCYVSSKPDTNSNDQSIATTAWVTSKVSDTKKELDTSIQSNASSITGINSQIVTIKENVSNLQSGLSQTNTNVSNLSSNVSSSYVKLATAQTISGAKTFSASELKVTSSKYPDNGLVLNVTQDGGGILLQSKNYCLKADAVTLDATDDEAFARLFIGDKNASKALREIRLYQDGRLTWTGKTILFAPDYTKQIYATGVDQNTWVKCDKTSFVIVWGGKSYQAQFEVHIKSPSGGDFIVGAYYNDTNSNTRGCSFPFIVPAGWSFKCPWGHTSDSISIINKNNYRIYPMTIAG